MLAPSLRGIFWHRCKQCKACLPTLDLWGRKRLVKICPACQSILHQGIGQRKSIHIALVGGSAAGKTTCMIAALQALRQANKEYTSVSFVDDAQENAFEKNVAAFKKRRMHIKSAITPQAGVLQLRRLWSTKLLYLYDPGGEAFKNTASASKQTYYSYSNGFIFVIDGSAFRQEGADRLEVALVMRVYECMMQAFESYAGLLSARRRYEQPVAVVLNKASALSEQIAAHGGSSHEALRKLLCAHRLDHFVRDLEAHFSLVGYFACESLQALRDGKVQASENANGDALAPLRWLLARA